MLFRYRKGRRGLAAVYRRRVVGQSKPAGGLARPDSNANTTSCPRVTRAELHHCPHGLTALLDPREHPSAI
jgi:hypothetical protein